MDKHKDPPSLEDCLGAADETRALVLRKNALEAVPPLLKAHYACDAVYLIADTNTFKAAGEAVRDILTAGGITLAGSCIFPPERLHADYAHVTELAGRIRAAAGGASLVPVSAGAGTINDLVKRAAGELALPYLCVPTAASVDGYTSSGAALLKDGFKQTLPCAAPRALAADTDILAGAPAYLSSSGFGDLAGKLIAGSDWRIAEIAGSLGAPGTEPINGKAWAMTQTDLAGTLRRSAGAVRGDGDAVKTLFKALAVTGFAMQYLKSSRPVSGCEHLYSHIWEMENLEAGGIPVTHGHKVAMGTLAASAFTEILFSRREAPAGGFKRPGPGEREAEVRGAFRGIGEAAERAAVKTALEKLPDAASAAVLAGALRDNWKRIRERVLEQILPYGELRALLGKGGCPLKPEEINLTRERIIAASRRAQMIRNRYTVLDLAWDLGVFEEVLSRMEESAEYLR
ncbi:MAG: sn-glycerol-1-phosphate dehydrogenase [Spirochaetaceae bacterium]|jgi:glycerol-1-phosphate dehydrogenase [NAD(P)+]|nr:sn-glycerol-1-phosphate dehydrogenase [Spirochaetaceae bacterium]